MRNRLRKIATVLATIYLGVLVLLMLLETTLLYPAPPSTRGDWQADWLDHEDVYFTSSDGTSLHGWYCPKVDARRSILFCHGNGEDVSNLADELDFLRRTYQANVFAFDYRGYGHSQGRPKEAGILADGEAAQRWLAERTGREPGQIVLWGRSLGGAVAVHLASQHGAAALVLDRTFSSMVDVAASHYPWLPIRWLLRNRYPSIDKLPRYTGPLIQFHGQPDEVVPYRFAQALFAASRSTNKQFIASESLTHNDPWPDEFYQRVQDFLRDAIDD